MCDKQWKNAEKGKMRAGSVIACRIQGFEKYSQLNRFK
jgi:hypothetical protein